MMKSNNIYCALLDIGGTYTKLKVVSFTKNKYKLILKKKEIVKSKKELYNFFKKYFKNFYPLDVCIFCIAGPVLEKNKGFMTNWEGKPEINFLKIKKEFGIKKFFLLNDMEAQGYGLLSLKKKGLLYKKAKILYGNLKKIKDGNMALIVPGTGLGSAFIDLKGNVFPSELQHSIYYPNNENYIKENFKSYESFVSGEGLFNNYCKLKNKNIKKVKDKGNYVKKMAEKGDRKAIEAMDLYFYVLGVYAQAMALAFKPLGGIFFSGKPLKRNFNFFKNTQFSKVFLKNPKQKKLLSKIPLFFIDYDLVFEGLIYMIKYLKGIFMKKYRCTVCGYIYDPELGDPDNGITAGTSFEDLPEDWVCPICGVGKDQFVSE